mmetsp:Transcript_7609/g.27909  ORF Transcript_7609/g.27909 Transcript_7609/m.27909 type:complete len:217 (-) Transcript_7609:1939-2589(-)
MHDQVRVVHGASERRQQIEDVGVVVQERASFDVRVELDARLHVEALVEVHLLLAQSVFSDDDLDRRQVQILLPLLLRAPQHDLAEHVVAQRHEGSLPGAHVAVLDDRVRDVLLEGGEVHEAHVAAVRAVPLAHEAEALAVAALLLTVVEGVRAEAEEADQRVELAHAVLQGRAREAPLHPAPKRVRRLRGAVRAALDPVRLVQDDAGPHDGVQGRV